MQATFVRGNVADLLSCGKGCKPGHLQRIQGTAHRRRKNAGGHTAAIQDVVVTKTTQATKVGECTFRVLRVVHD